MSITWSEVSRGVPRSPNRHLGQFRILRQVDVARRKVELNSFSDVRAGFRLGFTSRRTAGEFGAHRRVVTGLGILFQDDSERHTNSIWQSYDIRLVGRDLTVVFNGKKVLDKVEVEGLTAIATNSDEADPGPFIVQGDHSYVEIKSFVVTPLIH